MLANRLLYRLTKCLVLLPTLATLSCHQAHQERQEESKFVVTNPLRTNTELTKDYVAQVRAIQHIELRALERGYLQGVFVDEGQRVTKGTRMFQIMPLVYQAEVKKATAEEELTELEVSNTKSLADKNVVSSRELALAEARANKAKAEVELATTHKSLTEFRAPFAGLVGRFHARLGSLVDEGDLLATLSDNDTMWVYFNLSEAEYLKYKSQPQASETATVKLVMANGQLYDQTGKVEAIEADFNNDTGNIAFRATFLNPKGLLRHGETGKVLMSVPLKNALVIPQKATFDVLDNKFVFVVDAHNIVRSRRITVGAEKSQIYVIESGLTEQDKILIEGLRKVSDGVAVQTEFQPPGEVLRQLEVPSE